MSVVPGSFGRFDGCTKYLELKFSFCRLTPIRAYSFIQLLFMFMNWRDSSNLQSDTLWSSAPQLKHLNSEGISPFASRRKGRGTSFTTRYIGISMGVLGSAEYLSRWNGLSDRGASCLCHLSRMM